MNIIPMKHLLVTRDGEIYWYVGDGLNTKDESNEKIDLIACGTDINCLLSNGWTNNLLAKRDGYWDIIAENARDKDIIYIYEITDMTQWLSIFHEYKFIKPVMLKKGFTWKPYVKLVYELIDNVPNFKIN